MQMYSQLEDKFFLRLSDNERREVMVSGTGLSWDGTSENTNKCSYAQKMSELEASGIDSSGRHLIYAPAIFSRGASSLHLSPNVKGYYEAFHPSLITCLSVSACCGIWDGR